MIELFAITTASGWDAWGDEVEGECRKRYRILKGSADSGKSVNIAQDYIAKLSDPYYTDANLLVVRKIEETNRDSTFAELQAAIYRMFEAYANKFWKVNLNPLSLLSQYIKVLLFCNLFKTSISFLSNFVFIQKFLV